MVKIELIYDKDCPNVEKTKKELRAALKELNLEVSWIEWDRADKNAPSYVKQYGSPTILINGRDVSGTDGTSDDNCCRVYLTEDSKLSGVPSKELILKSLKSALKEKSFKGSLPSGKKTLLSVLPAVGASLLPAISCPACWPAYTGLLSALGLGFINYTPFLLPLMIVLLLIALYPFLKDAKASGRYALFYTALAASLLIVVGKFLIKSSILTYTGIVLLIVVSFYNAFSRKKNTYCSVSPLKKDCCV